MSRKSEQLKNKVVTLSGLLI